LVDEFVRTETAQSSQEYMILVAVNSVDVTEVKTEQDTMMDVSKTAYW
jgi:hypothetical protein